MKDYTKNASSPKRPIDWVSTLFLTLTPIFALILVPFYFTQQHPSWEIIALTAFMYFASNIGITAGYHRLFSHRSYKAKPWVKALLLFFGASAFQASVLKWTTDHRRHHKVVDTDEDPYSIKKGFFFAHFGWMLVQTDEKYKNKFAADLENDPMIKWQHDHYLVSSIFSGFAFPTIIGAMLGDAFGGFVFAGLLRIVLGHHGTFCINSLCHMWGRQPYTNSNSARDSIIMAFVTSGEGYHNFHHQFESDYRNGIKWYHWDPTKWFIKFLSFFGQTYNLRQMSNFVLLRQRLKHQQNSLALKGISNENLDRLRLKVETAQRRWRELKAEYKTEYSAFKKNIEDQSRENLLHLKVEVRLAKIEFKKNMSQWKAYVKTMQALQSS